jgi:hypothetical protein
MTIEQTKQSKSVLVINPPCIVHGDFIDYPCFVNLGALQVASAIAAAGFGVDVADAFAQKRSGATSLDEGLFLLGCETATFVKNMPAKTFGAIVLCLSVFHRPFERTESIAEMFSAIRKKYPKTPIVAADAYFGGLHYIDYDSDVFL